MEKNVTISWIRSNSEFADELAARWSTEDDWARARGRTPSACRLSILAWAGMRALLARETGVARWRFTSDSRGKPYAWQETGEPGPSISLAHGGNLVAVALGGMGAPVGVDVEPHRPKDIRSLALAAFGPVEQDSVATGGIPAFFRLWTLREAMGKATGAGLALAADGQDRIGSGPTYGSWRSGAWLLAHLEPEPGYSLAVALHGATAMQMRQVDLYGN